MYCRSATRVSGQRRRCTASGLTLWVTAVPEVVLLAIGSAEDVVSKQVYGYNERGVDRAELNLVENQVAGLKGVDEGNPSQVAHCKHETEAIRGDVHGGEDRRLHGGVGWL